jgi:hypothetical protein
MSSGEASPSVLATVEGLSKAAVAVLGVIYALGLAVVSLHLAAYGSSGLGLLQEQYVLAGMWALFPLAAIGFVVVVIVGTALDEYGRTAPDDRVKKDRKRPRRWLSIGRKALEAAAAAFGWIIVVSFFFGFVSPQIADPDAANLGVGRLIVLALEVAGFAAALCLLSAGGVTTIIGREQPNVLLGTVMLGTAFVVLIGYLGFFTASVYPLIPATVGGGHPRRVQVVLKGRNPEASMAALLAGTAPPELVSEHRLLFITDKVYIVIDPVDSHRAIEIPKDLVTAVRTIGR